MKKLALPLIALSAIITAPAAGAAPEKPNYLENTRNQGDQTIIKGTPATLCLVGDGYGVSYLLAGPHTSCHFAAAVFSAQRSGLKDSTERMREHLKPDIDATSPVTRQTYRMHCAIEQDQLIRCTGARDATVFIY